MRYQGGNGDGASAYRDVLSDVTADHVRLSQSAARAVTGNRVEVHQSAAQRLSGAEVTLDHSVVVAVRADHLVADHVNAIALLAREAQVQDSRTFLLAAPVVRGNVRAVVDFRAAFAFGFGAAAAVVAMRLLRRLAFGLAG